MSSCSSSQISLGLPRDTEHNFPPLLTSSGQDVVIKTLGALNFRAICDYYFKYLSRAEYVFTNEPIREVLSPCKHLIFYHLNNDIYVSRAQYYARGGYKYCHLAVKLNTCEVINISKTSDPKVRKEIQVLEYLRSQRSFGYSHISHLRDWGVSEWITYQFSDYSNGRSMDCYLRGHKLSQRTKLNVTAQLLRGLVFIHSKGYVHLDIKPENTLLSTRYVGAKKKFLVKICDFGSVARENNLEEKFQRSGTIEYMSPEQSVVANLFLEFSKTTPLPAEVVDKVNRISYSSDIYSLGLSLQRMFGNSETSYKEFWGERWGTRSSLVSFAPSDRPSAAQCLQTVYQDLDNYKQKGKS